MTTQNKKNVKYHHVHPAAWECVHWLPRYAGTVIYRCIALLQLLLMYVRSKTHTAATMTLARLISKSAKK
jgi:hypothetical protein